MPVQLQNSPSMQNNLILTTNWQSVAQYNFRPASGFSLDIFLDARYTTQSNSANSTNVLTRLRSVVNVGSGSGYGYSFNCTYCTPISGSTLWTFATETILESSEQTIYHDDDGTKSINLSASGYVRGANFSFNINTVVDLPKIDRLPIITSIPTSITDESNINIVFENPGNFYIKAYFYKLSGYNFERENITSPYVFELTDTERNTIRNYMRNMTTDPLATITLETYTSDDFAESSKIGEVTRQIEVRIINAEPTASLSVVENEQKVKDVYGDDTTTYVKNVSRLNLSSTVTLKKYATLKTKSYSYNNGETIVADEVTITPIDKNVSVTVTDSRNLQVVDTSELNLVEYIPIQINSFDVKRKTQTSDTVVLNASITYYQATYNTTVNSPILQYKLGQNGSLRTLTDTDYHLDSDNNRITITGLELTDKLLYTKLDTVYFYVSDIFTKDEESKLVTKGIPTFEAGEHDFKVNGTLYVADEVGENSVDVMDKLNNMVVDNLDSSQPDKAPSQRAVKNALNKPIFLASLSAVTTMSFPVSMTYYQIPFNTVGYSTGNNLTLQNGNVVIGENIDKIRITVQFNWYNFELPQDKTVVITKNGQDMINIGYVHYPSSVLYSTLTGFGILDVTNGDTISVKVASAATGNCRLFPYTKILIEVI